jgi:hypothetical protein
MGYSCGSGCTVTEDNFAVITNTLPTAVTVEFRPLNYKTPEKTRTIQPAETSYTWLTRFEGRESGKVNTIGALCTDYYSFDGEILEFTNATLAQYTVCGNGEEYAVLASGQTCTAPHFHQETSGW